MNPHENLELEQKIIDKNKHFIVYNKQCLCDHGGFHPMIEIKGKYIPGNVYNRIK